MKDRWIKVKAYFQEKSGGKTIVAIRRGAGWGIGLMVSIALGMAWLAPRADHTYYIQTLAAQKSEPQRGQNQPAVSSSLVTLFENGQRQKEAENKRADEGKRRTVTIRYFAPQILGVNSKRPRSIRSGSKLIGRLLNPIDTRHPSFVRASLPQGGEASGVVIERESTLTGEFSYSGSGERVLMTFARLDSPEGDSKSIRAQALSARDYSIGIVGEEFTGSGIKIAASLGLTMFSGMADTLTERESLGNNFNGVQAKPSMKNALLQGGSRAAQEQAGRTASALDQGQNYVLIPEGKEMIIELSEDFGK